MNAPERSEASPPAPSTPPPTRLSISENSAAPNDKRSGLISESLLAAFMACSLVLALTDMFQYSFSPLEIGLFAVLFSLMWAAVFTRPRAAYVLVGVLLLALVVLALQALLGQPFWSNRDGVFVSFVSWVSRSANDNVAAPGGFLTATAALLCLVAGFVTTCFVVTQVTPIIPLVFGSAIFLLGFLREDAPNVAAFSLFLLSTALYILRYRFLRRQADRRVPTGRFVLSVLPMCLAAVALTLALPAEGEYKPLAEEIGDLFPGVQPDWGHTDLFNFAGLSATGGEPSGGELGGPRRKNPSIMLMVETDRNTYLRGRAYGDYTGHSWEDFTYPHELYTSALDAPRFVLDTASSESYFKLMYAPNMPDDPWKTLIERASFRMGLGVVSARENPLPWLAPPSGGISIAPDGIVKYSTVPPGGGSSDGSAAADPPIITLDGQTLPLLGVVQNSKQTVTFQALRTKTIFLGDGTWRVGFPEPFDVWTDTLTVNPAGDMALSGAVGQDFTYEMETANLDLTDVQKASLYRMSHRGLSVELLTNGGTAGRRLDSYISSSLGLDVPSYSSLALLYSPQLAYLAEASDTAYNEFTALPDTVPDRVLDLARDITSGVVSDYDRADAICQYLRTNFTYDLDMPAPDRNRDFVDQFLFEQKRGYCTYFATAMVVMTRSLGLPARYVEGFAPAPTANSGIYIATGDNAHAWVEVYFDGFGWVTFDPTAPVATAMDAAAAVSPPSPSPSPSALPSVAPSARPSAPPDSVSVDWIWPVAGLLLLLAAGFLVWRLLRRRRPSAAAPTPRQKANAAFVRLGAALARKGVTPKLAGETPIAFGERVDTWGKTSAENTRALWTCNPPVKRLAEEYAALIYAPGEPQQQAVDHWIEHARGWIEE